MLKADFYKEIHEWLLPLGYAEIYNKSTSEYHFGKDGIRVVCVYNQGFYLTANFFSNPFTLTLKTSRYDINDRNKNKIFDELLTHLKSSIEKLTT